MPHIVSDDEDGGSISYNQNVPDILDHTHNCYYAAPTSSTSSLESTQQGSTVARTRQELMFEVEDTIEKLIRSIALGETIRLPFTCRNSATTKTQASRT